MTPTLTIELDGERLVLTGRVAALVSEIIGQRDLIAALPRGGISQRWEGDTVHPCWFKVQGKAMGAHRQP